MSTEFPQRARRGDDNGHMVVQENLYFLRDTFDQSLAKILGGSATILSGAAFVDVTFTPSLAIYFVAISPLADPGGRVWVSNKASSQFRINSTIAAPVAGLPFDWVLKGA